jgi:two-component system response regulator AtoC
MLSWAGEDLLASVRAVLENKRLREENRLLRRQVERTYCCGDLLGKSAVMQKVCERIQRTAETDFDVLIVGETGTGKELVAHAIHHRSKRKDKPFAPVNCGAIPEELLESEFFGHERGAFTGAQSRSLGLLEFANHGTFFLDELNQLPLRLQGKLLRVVQERKIRRVGATNEIDIDVRIIAASSMSLEDAVKHGQFRADLYHRLNVARIELPPLRERTEDIPMLVHTFLERYGRELEKAPTQVSPEVLEVLINYPWPGNVRELQNVIKRALAWARQEVVTLEDLPDEVVAHAGDSPRPDPGGFFHLRERRIAAFEKEYFQTLLQGCRETPRRRARGPVAPRHALSPAQKV